MLQKTLYIWTILQFFCLQPCFSQIPGNNLTSLFNKSRSQTQFSLNLNFRSILQVTLHHRSSEWCWKYSVDNTNIGFVPLSGIQMICLVL